MLICISENFRPFESINSDSILGRSRYPNSERRWLIVFIIIFPHLSSMAYSFIHFDVLLNSSAILAIIFSGFLIPCSFAMYIMSSFVIFLYFPPIVRHLSNSASVPYLLKYCVLHSPFIKFLINKKSIRIKINAMALKQKPCYPFTPISDLGVDDGEDLFLLLGCLSLDGGSASHEFVCLRAVLKSGCIDLNIEECSPYGSMGCQCTNPGIRN